MTLAIAIVAFACHSVAGFAADAAAKSGQSILSYFDATGSFHHWIFWDARSRTMKVFLETPTQPRLIFWNISAQHVYYALGPRIFTADYGVSNPNPSYVANLPKGDIELMWKEQQTHRLRVVILEDVPNRDIIKDSKGAFIYRLSDGSKLPAPNFPDGVPAVCTVFELSPGGKWAVLAIRATKTEAGDAPGLDVIEDLHHEDGVSQDRLLMSYTYAYGRLGRLAADVPPKIAPFLRCRRGYMISDFRYIAGRDGFDGLLFPVVMGDTAHAEKPLFLVSKEGKLRPVELQANRDPFDDQIGLGLHDRYLLVADEYSGDNPTVIDLVTYQMLLSMHGRCAVWIPFAPLD